MPHFLWPEPLSPAQLKRLEEHKYTASGRSMFEPPCQIYWNWLIEQIPTWIAPNTLTIVGLIINILTTVVLVYYCPTATEEVSKATLAQVSTRELTLAPITCPSLGWRILHSKNWVQDTWPPVQTFPASMANLRYILNQQSLLVNSVYICASQLLIKIQFNINGVTPPANAHGGVFWQKVQAISN